MSDDLRVQAMDYALATRANAEQDVVELAERIHDFLAPRNEIPESAKAILGGASPPPIPELVQQVRHDADLSQADQSPALKPSTVALLKEFAVTHDPFPDDDTKTRIISRT